MSRGRQQHRGRIRRLALAALCWVTAAVAGGGRTPAVEFTPVAAQSAARFVDSIGVNTHFNYERTVYARRFDEVKRRLLELGVRHVRDEAFDERQHPAALRRYRELAGAGIRFCFYCFERAPAHPGRSPIEAKLAMIRDHFAESTVYVEGHNEPDGSWPDKSQWAAGSTAYIGAIRAAVRADPVLRHIPIAGSALAHPERPAVREAMRQPDPSALVDVANCHPYSGGTPNESRIERRLAEVREYYRNDRLIATEVGYHTAVNNAPRGHEPTTEEVRAIYLPRLLMENFRLGIERSYIYQLLDTSPPNLTDIETLFGLLTYDLQETPHFRALKNLIAILRDEGSAPWTPGALNYSIVNAPADLRTVLLQKRSGAFNLAVWLPLKNWDQIKRQPIAVTSQAVTLNFAGPMVAVREFRPNDSTQPGRTVQATTSIALSLDARLVILELTPAP